MNTGNRLLIRRRRSKRGNVFCTVIFDGRPITVSGYKAEAIYLMAARGGVRRTDLGSHHLPETIRRLRVDLGLPIETRMLDSSSGEGNYALYRLAEPARVQLRAYGGRFGQFPR